MIKIIIMPILAALSLSANADTYGGIEGGFASVKTNAQATAQTIANLSGSAVTYTYDKGVYVGRAYISRDLDDKIAIEVGGFVSSAATNTYVLSGASALEDYSATGLDVSTVFKLADTGIFTKAGFHYSQASGSTSVSIGGATYAAKGDSSGAGLLVGIGYQAKLSEDTYWRTTYSYYDRIGGLSGVNINLLTIGILKKF
jgi:hypothetical protein